MTVFGLRLHILDVHDPAIILDEGHRERNQRVAHPHALDRLAVENKQHAVVRGQGLAKHEAASTHRIVRRDFRSDQMKSRGELDDLGCRLRGEAPRGLWPAFPAWDELLARAARPASGDQDGPRRPRVELALDPEAPGPFAHPPSYSGRLREFLQACATEARARLVVVVSQQDARLRELLAELPPASAARRAPGRRRGSVMFCWV